MELFSFVVDWTIRVGDKNVKLYVDAECTTPMVGAVHFGQVPQGATRDFGFYVRNEGLIPTDVVLSHTTPPPYMTVTIDPEMIAGLAPGAVEMVTLALVAAVDAPLEDGEITVAGDDGQP